MNPEKAKLSVTLERFLELALQPGRNRLRTVSFPVSGKGSAAQRDLGLTLTLGCHTFTGQTNRFFKIASVAG